MQAAVPLYELPVFHCAALEADMALGVLEHASVLKQGLCFATLLFIITS